MPGSGADLTYFPQTHLLLPVRTLCWRCHGRVTSLQRRRFKLGEHRPGGPSRWVWGKYVQLK
jgi:hypothetical protein